MANKIFLCPLDTIPSAFGDAYRRSYALNNNVAVRENPPASKANRYSDINDAAELIFMSEYIIAQNSLGKNGRAGLSKPQTQVDAGSYDYHGAYQFNYLFVDGHAKVMNIFSTVGAGDVNGPLGMWSLATGD